MAAAGDRGDCGRGPRACSRPHRGIAGQCQLDPHRVGWPWDAPQLVVHPFRSVLDHPCSTAAYIVTEQILLRSAEPDKPVPGTGFIVAIVLLIATGIALIWYITTVTRWSRVDRVAKRIRKGLLVAAEVRDMLRGSSAPATVAASDRPTSRHRR